MWSNSLFFFLLDFYRFKIRMWWKCNRKIFKVYLPFSLINFIVPSIFPLSNAFLLLHTIQSIDPIIASAGNLIPGSQHTSWITKQLSGFKCPLFPLLSLFQLLLLHSPTPCKLGLLFSPQILILSFFLFCHCRFFFFFTLFPSHSADSVSSLASTFVVRPQRYILNF